MSRTTAEMTKELESIVDEFGLQAVLRALEEISYEKAAHLRTNWQDETTAKAWEHAAKRIEEVASNPRIVKVSP